MKKNFFTILLLLFVFAGISSLYAQERKIQGSVFDSNTGEPIPNVKVEVKGTSTHTITNSDGSFVLMIPADISSVSFSEFEGKSVSEIRILGDDTYNIYLSVNIEIFDLSLEELMNYKVTSVSKRAESILIAPQTVIVLSEADIINRGYTDIEQMLHDLPGFDISRGSGVQYAQIYQRGYRSNNTDRTMIMIDGIEQNDLWSNSAWIARQLPISNIKRVEVIYGPSSTIYGANAFLGVINIITKGSSDLIKPGKYFGASAHAAYGSYNTAFGDLCLSGKYKDVSLTVTGRYFTSDNNDLSEYDDYDFDMTDYSVEHYMNLLGTTADSAEMARNLDLEGYKVNGENHTYENKSDNYFVDAKLKIKDFTLGFQYWYRNDQYGAWYRDIYEFGNWVSAHTYLYSTYEKEISKKFTISNTNVFKVNHLLGTPNHDYWYVGYVNGGLGMDNLRNNEMPYWWESYYGVYSEQFRSELRATYTPIEQINIISGVEYRQGVVQGNYFVSAHPDINPEETGIRNDLPGGNHFFSRDIGVFAQANYKPHKTLSVVLGGRLDNNKIRITGGYGTEFNPKGAIIWSPGKFVFKGIYSQAFKDAGNWTKYSETDYRIPNPSLDPEKVRNIEGSAGVQVTSNLFFDIVAYKSFYSDIVNEVDFGDYSQNVPVGKLEIMGVQSRLNFKQGNYSAYMYYSYTDPYSIGENGDKVRIGDIATHKLAAGTEARFMKKLTLSLRGNYVGARPTGSETTISANPFDEIDAYFILNGAVMYEIYKGISAQVIARNILDTEYFHPGVRAADGDYYAARLPQNGRNLYLRLIYNF